MKKAIIPLWGNLRRHVTNFWHRLGPVRCAILGVGVLATAINETWSLCQKVRDVSSGSESCKNEFVPSGAATCEISPAPPLDVPKVENKKKVELPAADRRTLDFFLGQMHASYQKGDYSSAVEFANLAEHEISICATNDFLTEMLSVMSVQIEDAFYQGNFRRVQSLIKKTKSFPGVVVADTPSYWALRDISVLLGEGGNEMFFFSPTELGMMRKWDKEFLEEYLSYLAAWGYLQPIMLDPRTRNHHTFYYEDFFGFEKPLPYQNRWHVSATNVAGHVVDSNEASVRWVGRKKFVPLDVDLCIKRAMSLKEDERYHRGLWLNVEVTNDCRNVRMAWAIRPGYQVATNSPCRVMYATAWMPGMKSPSTELNTVYISEVNERRIGMPYIPRWVWIVILTLVCMAFASPTSASQTGEGMNTLRHDDAKDERAKSHWLVENKLYVYAFVVASMVAVVARLFECNVLAGVAAVSDSIVAAVVFAKLFDAAKAKRDHERAVMARGKYLAELKQELMKIFGRLIWLDSCMTDPWFDWSLAPSEYVGYPFAKKAYLTHPPADMSWSNLSTRLDAIRKTYNSEGFSKMSKIDAVHAFKMFEIVFSASRNILGVLDQLETHRIELAANGMMDYDECASICKNIRCGMRMLIANRVNSLPIAIDFLISAIKAVAGDAVTTDRFSIEMYASF